MSAASRAGVAGPLLLAAAFACVGARAAQVAAPVISPPDTWLPRQGAQVKVLDKISAQASAASLSVGQTVTVQSLSITLRACVTRPPDLPPDSAAFLDVVDSHKDAPDFHGWMFSGEPQLGSIQNPLYDLRLTGCRSQDQDDRK